MSDYIVKIANKKTCSFYGIWKNSNDKTISKDIQELTNQYNEKIDKKEGEVIVPFVVLSRNYQPDTRDFELFVGGTKPLEGLETIQLAGGKYATITIKPLLGWLWGPAIKKAKKYVYQKWLPNTNLEASNLEYEFHTQKTIEKSPTLDIIFSVHDKT